MSRVVHVDFACNDPDNGNFAGKVEMASIDGNELARGDGAVAFTVLPNTIRVHRKKFLVLRSHDWVGNWCWNRYAMTVKEANRLASHLRDNGWHCECGDERFYEWFNRTSEARG